MVDNGGDDGPGANGQLLLRRRIRLPQSTASPGAARRALRQALEEGDRVRWLEDAELLLSEVVTNATLHAHTEIEVAIDLAPDAVCVEVRDHDPTPPLERDYGSEAMTGRGMGLVAALAKRYGVRSLGRAGKVVWFCVGDERDGDGFVPEDVLATWDVEDWEHDRPPDGDTREVVLEAMPVTLWLAARRHHDALVRDLCWYLASHHLSSVDVTSADRARSAISATLVAAVEERGGGDEPVDLHVAVPADSGPTFSTLQDVLDLAEALAIEGALLVSPGLPEIVAVRDWACDQVVAQLAGAPSAAWPGTAQQRFETDVRRRSVPGPAWDAASVTGADRPVVAADEANRIVAVSDPLVELLGWDRDHLVGRRVVTIVPPAWREAHVAGFTRYLSTGETHILDVEVELPVLAADGTEIACRVLIERPLSTPGHSVFVAWIDPA